MSGLWDLVHAERRALVDDLAAVPPGEWERPSLCPGWTVHDVVAHLVDTALTTRLGFVAGQVRARFDFDRQNARGVARHRGATPAETLDRLASVVRRTSAPPGSLDSRLVEEVVHGEDVRRPLGLTRSYPDQAVRRALAYQARTPAAFGGSRELLAGRRLDVDDPVELLLVATGRLPG